MAREGGKTVASGLLESAAVAVVVFEGEGGEIAASYGDPWLRMDLGTGGALAEAAAARPRASEIVQLDGRLVELHYEPRAGQARPFLVALDVTEHLRRDEEAIERERQLLHMARQLPAIAWATDRDLRITHLLGHLPSELGLDEGTIVGASLRDLVEAPQDAADPAIAHHNAALLGRRGRFRYRFRERWYEVHVAPLRDARESITGCVGTAIDVTERKQSEDRSAVIQAALAESQRLAHVGSWRWDIRQNHVTWSDELHRIYGLPPGSFAGGFEAFVGRVHPEDRERTQVVLFEALRKVQPFRYDHRVVRPDGTIRMLRTSGHVEVDGSGEPVKLSGACSDITEHWETQEALRRTVSILEATIESTVDGLLLVDREGKVSAYNQRFLSLWRIPDAIAERADDEALLAFVGDQLEDKNGFLRGVHALYGHPEDESLDILRFKDGRVFERYSRPQRVDEAVVGRVWSFRDVTERERLLRRALFLADASRLLTSLDAEQALDGVARLAVPSICDGFVVDLLGNGAPRRLVATWRDSARELSVGVPSAVLAGHPLIDEVGGSSRISVPLIARGRVIGALTLAAAPGRKYSHTDLELAEELASRSAISIENARLYQATQEAVRSREEFLAVAAHEIRGPLTALRLAVQSLSRGQGPSEKMIDTIGREERRLARFVDELLDVGRLRTGVLELLLEPTDLGQVVREVSSRLSSDLARSGSPLAIKIQPGATGHWDRARLDQIVSNLLSNAIKFGLGKPIDVAVTPRGDRVLLSVIDRGIGIPEEMREAIFEPFARAVPARYYGGLGLGLYIVRTIVRALGGTVAVESSPGRGSTFTIELPARSGR